MCMSMNQPPFAVEEHLILLHIPDIITVYRFHT